MRHFFQKVDNSAPAGTFQTISEVQVSSAELWIVAYSPTFLYDIFVVPPYPEP
jgi:hypothetical protein